MGTYKTVRRTEDGMAVSAAVANRSVNDLDTNIQYIKDKLDLLQYLSTRLIFPNAPVSDTVIDSQAVYLNQSSEKWEESVLSISGIEESTQLSMDDSCFVQGIVKNISGAIGSKVGDIYLYGKVSGVYALNMTEDGSSPTVMAPYYLSSNNPGRITTIPPTIGKIFVGKFINLTDFVFTPSISINGNNSLAHDHFWFTLVNATFVANGDHDGIPQWIYHAEDIPVFPPIPATSAVLVVNGVEMTYGENYEITSDGLLFWSDTLDVPTDPNVQYKLYIAKVTSESSYVSALFPKTSNVVIVDPETGEDDSSGMLDIGVINTFSTIKSNQTGKNVLKLISSHPTTGDIQCYFGDVVEQVLAGSGISVSSNQGTVSISTQAPAYEGDEISDIILLNAREEIYEDSTLSYIEFPKNIDSKIVAKFHIDSVPRDVSVIGYFFGSADDGNECSLSISYSIHKLGSGIQTAKISSVKSFLVSKNTQRLALFNISKTSLTKDDFVSLDVSRLSTDSYLGDLGLIKLKRIEQ